MKNKIKLSIMTFGLCLAFLSQATCGTAMDNYKRKKMWTKHGVVQIMEKVADWQLANPSGKKLNTWEYAPFYMGLMQLYKTTKEKKYYDAVVAMGETVHWQPRPRPYDANVLAITQVFYELFEMTGDTSMIDKSQFVMDMSLARNLKPELAFAHNKYWWEWWTWCDALYMAPPAFASLATVLKQPQYMDFMVQRWWLVSDYLYSPEDSLFFRDDRFFDRRSKNGNKVFWARGNGWVIGGLCRLMDYMPENHPARAKFERQFVEMATRLGALQLANGYWSPSLLDADEYPQKETSGTAFFCYALAWGINHGLLPKDKFLPVVQSAWEALVAAIHPDGKLGYVQKVGDQPDNVKYDDTETYGTGAFLQAGCEFYKLLE